MGLVFITVVLTLIYLHTKEYGFFVYLVAFMWGVEDGAVNTHCLEMLGFEFDDNTEPFSIFSMFEAVAVFLFQIIQSFVDDADGSGTNFAIYVAITGVLGSLMCGVTYFFDFKEKK